MIIMGGTFPGGDYCDAPKVLGQHNLNLGKIGYSPGSGKWYAYIPDLEIVRVPDEITAIIGGRCV
jgi:hypothetical protein